MIGNSELMTRIGLDKRPLSPSTPELTATRKERRRRVTPKLFLLQAMAREFLKQRVAMEGARSFLDRCRGLDIR